MAILQVKVSPKELLQAVEQLEPSEFAAFFQAVLHVKAERIAPALTQEEESLLKRIYALRLPEDERNRLLYLGAQLEAETISEADLRELQTLNERSELLNAERIATLAQLSLLRQQPLREVMTQLGWWNSYDNQIDPYTSCSRRPN